MIAGDFGSVELRHGYTMLDLHNMTRFAVHLGSGETVSWYERYECAWSAIAEYLYRCEDTPDRDDLIQIGRRAIYEEVHAFRQRYGFYKHKTIGSSAGMASSPAFRTYWWDFLNNSSVPSCETRTVERTSLGQILPMLTAQQQHCILALAIHDNYQSAAAALGLTDVTFKSHISRARRAFLHLWHEGEIPSRPWGVDRRCATRAGTRRQANVMDAVRRRSRSQGVEHV